MNLLALFSRTARHRNAAFAAVSNILHAALSLLTFGLIARQLTPGGYGTWVLAWSIVTAFVLLANWGLGRAAARYLAPDLVQGSFWTRAIIRDALILKIAMGIGASLLCLVLSAALAESSRFAPLAPLLQAGSVSVFVWSLSDFCMVLLQGARRLHLLGIAYLLEGTAKLLFAPILTSRIGMIGATWGLSLAYSCGALVGLVAVYMGIYRHAPASDPKSSQLPYAGPILKYAMPILLASAAGFVFLESGQILLGLLSTQEQVGYYSVANSFARSLILAAGLVAMLIGPAFAQTKALQPETLSRLYDRATRSYLWILGLICALLFGLSEPLVIIIFGREYVNAVPVLRLLVFGILLVAISQMYSAMLDYFGQARLRSVMLVATTALYLGLGVVLIPQWAGMGAALAILLSFFPYTLYTMVHAGTICNARLGKAVLLIGLTIVGSFLAGLAGTLVSFSNLAIGLVIASIVSVGTYALLVTPLQLIRRRDATTAALP